LGRCWDRNRGGSFTATNEPVWIAVGVAIGAALSSKKLKNKNLIKDEK